MFQKGFLPSPLERTSDLVPGACLDTAVGSRVHGESDEILLICLFLHGHLSRWEASQKVNWKSKEIKTLLLFESPRNVSYLVCLNTED